MKRGIVGLCLFVVCLQLAASAYAHSGRTDGGGGHHDGDGYHYHHGYPEHDHYDMDGDGDIDCPYNFVDKTDHGSGTSGDSGVSGSSSSEGTVVGYGDEGAQVEDQKSDDGGFPLWEIALIGVTAYLAIKGLWRYLTYRKKVAERSVILAKLGIGKLKLPSNVWLLDDGTPTLGEGTLDRPFGGYTVYTARKRNVYHIKYRCCGADNPCHLFEIPNGIRPCMRCAKGHQKPTEFPQWYLRLKNRDERITTAAPKIASENDKDSPVSHRKQKELNSTFIKKTEHKDGNMTLTFASGDTYVYYNVPKSVYDELVEADSPGSYFHEKINGEYPYYRK